MKATVKNRIGFNAQMTNEINGEITNLFVKAFEFKAQHDVDYTGDINENYLIDAQDAFWKVVDECIKDFKDANDE